MAEQTPQDRLQPALLDRLTDDEPRSQVEPRERRIVNLRRLRECVLRDLSWLLNTGPLSQVEDLEDFPEALHSVLDYGVRDMAGITLSSADSTEIERRVKQAILDFEPRILKRSLKVRSIAVEEESHRNAVGIEIEGELWAQPIPLRLYLQSEVDLEDGHMTIADRSEVGPA